MKKTSGILTALYALLCAAALCACSGGSEEDGAVTLAFPAGNNTHGVSLDPAVEYCGARNVAIGVCETLFRLNDETMAVEPHLAAGYEHPDELTWVITLRDDVSFSNGKKLTAEAARLALEYELDALPRLSTLLDAAAIEADGQVLTIRTGSPVAAVPNILTDTGLGIFDTAGSSDYAAGVIGTGPYILESLDGDGNCSLRRNDSYWQGLPGAERISTKFIPDADSAATLALQSGELDWAIVPPNDVALFENDPDYQLLSYETGRVYFLYINPGRTFTQDPALRQALQYAFDREAYLSAVYDGRGQAAYSIFPAWSEHYDASVVQPGYDPGAAREILAGAGYADSDGDGFLEKDGEKVTLGITCYPNNGFITLAEAIQGSLREIGIDSSITVSDSIVADLSAGGFNIATYGYTTLTMGDCMNFLEPVFETGGSSNFNGFSVAEVDALLAELRAEPDAQERARLSIEMQRHIYEQGEHIFLIHIGTTRVARAEVQNLTTGLGNNFSLWRVTK